MASASHRYESLDGLRGLFALAVVLFHANFASHLYGLPLIRNSYLSVDFFFVLSGFVIACAYGEQLTTGNDMRSFLIKRLGRIWPLHIVVLAVLVGIEALKLAVQHVGLVQFSNPPFTGPDSPFALITNILLLQSLDLHQTTTWNYPAWSISAELSAYALFALVVYVGRRWALWIAGAVVVAACMAIVKFSDSGMDLTFHLGAVRGCLGFFLGWLAYAAHRRQPDRSGSGMEIILAILVLAYIWSVGRSMVGYAAPFLFALVIYLIAGGRGVVSRALNSRPMQFLGRISYSIYMTHVAVLLVVRLGTNLLEHLLHRTLLVPAAQIYGPAFDESELLAVGGPWAMDAATIALVIVVISISALTYWFIEEPGRRLFARWASRPATARLSPRVT